MCTGLRLWSETTGQPPRNRPPPPVQQTPPAAKRPGSTASLPPRQPAQACRLTFGTPADVAQIPPELGPLRSTHVRQARIVFRSSLWTRAPVEYASQGAAPLHQGVAALAFPSTRVDLSASQCGPPSRPAQATARLATAFQPGQRFGGTIRGPSTALIPNAIFRARPVRLIPNPEAHLNQHAGNDDPIPTQFGLYGG